MTRAQAKKLDEVHAWTDFLINKITVNGDDGSAPITGVKNILEAHHKNDKTQNRQIAELMTVTQGLRAKKKFWKSLAELKATSPVLKFFLSPNKIKVAIGVLTMVFLSELAGFHGLTHTLMAILKFLGWMK